MNVELGVSATVGDVVGVVVKRVPDDWELPSQPAEYFYGKANADPIGFGGEKGR